MQRSELFRYIYETYGVRADQPWPDEPGYYTFRHKETLKWFGVILNVIGQKVGAGTSEEIEILLLKIDPDTREDLLAMPDIYPAWHMNKKHWISVAFDGELDDATVIKLIEKSFELTSPKRKKRP